MNKKNTPLKIILASITGFLNGFLGGGGGLFSVVALKNFYHLNTKNVHANTVAIIFPISFVSSVIYLSKNTFEPISLASIVLGSVAGGVIGAILLKKIKSNIVSWLFVIILYTAGVKMLLT
ncbi:MAG: sulfite exporter TauE/SafE family protein [Clostridia bacterium]|nr:sulfite exporter TauE/SafE family protein [Clostridia bacterium]